MTETPREYIRRREREAVQDAKYHSPEAKDLVKQQMDRAEKQQKWLRWKLGLEDSDPY